MFLPCFKTPKEATYNSPFEDVLGYLDGCWRVPLYGVRVWLFARLCDDHLDRSVTIWEKVKRGNIWMLSRRNLTNGEGSHMDV